VGDLGKPVLGGHGFGPTFNNRAFYLNRRAAAPAHQVVMMVFANAPSVEGLAFVVSDDVDVTGIRQGLKSSINRGQTHAAAPASQSVVHFLCGQKTIRVGQSLGNGASLFGRP